ncbi:MAG: hypothetical protein UV59_C0004G0008 [Candidatus Gottesmanbacteria bacterium GW2011_GWA1_43_11]|uniref:ArnT-like N-terminal domain-containing protein n=1 Tax=Candidatus Gottesmanbacteria bacterium GW2011_GWA1_43_11 TaxID=1618436 RepID=A0A0G1CJ63_9BACT|nr:MAG: hypothetical protein UV59_C0004G0008 [Candidatus Gottesmanbacteria bacterium GW2011_GWA1_43_11]
MKRKHFKTEKLALLIITIIASLLRVIKLDTYPPALYSDEVAQGYNAYSVLTTGLDEYGTWLPVSFRSFGDWKPPLPTYFMVPTIAVFGLNEYGIRISSALFGIGSVLLTYLLTKLLCKDSAVALVAAGILTISPWHIVQSRAAMLVSGELFFLLLALLAFFKGLTVKKWWIVSAVSWALVIYSYYAGRLIVPLILLFLFISFRKQILAAKTRLAVPVIAAFALLLPLGFALLNQPDVLFGRAKTVSVFYDQGVALTVWDLIAQDGNEMLPLMAQFFHNKPYHYVIDIVRRFFQYFDGRFLFLTGDKQLPFQIPNMGILYLVEAPLLLIGIRELVMKHKRIRSLLLFWIAVSVLPAALTFVTPASNRTFTMVVPFSILTALGIMALINKFNKSSISFFLVTALSAGYLFSFSNFFYQYTQVLPKQHADRWHFGYQELYRYLKSEEDQYKVIAISAKTSVPYIFLLYHYQMPPSEAIDAIDRNFVTDEFGFEHVNQVGKYRFPRHFAWEKDGVKLPAHSLLVLTPEEMAGSSAREKKQIYYPNGAIAFRIYEIE